MDRQQLRRSLPVGTWLVSNRAQTPTATELSEQYQDLPTTGAPYEFTITEATT